MGNVTESNTPANLKPLAGQFIDTLQQRLIGGCSAAVRQQAVTLLADTLAVGVAGASTLESQRARIVVEQWGGPPQANIWGGGPSVSTGGAAFINAHQVHTLEWDPIHEPGVVHAMTVVTPAVLVWAQSMTSRGEVVSGRQVIDGIIAGVEVAARLGVVTNSPLRFFRPATAGALGAVVGAGIMANWSLERIESAFGIAYGAISGTMQPHTEGAQVLALQIGFNARAAMNALDLAEAGFKGPRFVLEGKYGYYTLIETDGNPELLTAVDSTNWEIDRTGIKPFPSGRATHGALGGLLALQREHGFTRDTVDRVDIEVPSMVFGLVGRRPTADMPVGAARLCLAYLVPCLLDDGTISVDSYHIDRITNSDVLAWTDRVHVSADTNPDPNAFNPQRVTVTLKDGRTLVSDVPYSLGSPEHPLTPEQSRQKFDLAMTIGGRSQYADALYSYIHGIDEVEDITELWEIL